MEMRIDAALCRRAQERKTAMPAAFEESAKSVHAQPEAQTEAQTEEGSRT